MSEQKISTPIWIDTINKIIRKIKNSALGEQSQKQNKNLVGRHEDICCCL